MLAEYEQLLTARAEIMSSQTEEVEKLQREMEELQQSYENQIKTFQTKVEEQSGKERERERGIRLRVPNQNSHVKTASNIRPSKFNCALNKICVRRFRRNCVLEKTKFYFSLAFSSLIL